MTLFSKSAKLSNLTGELKKIFDSNVARQFKKKIIEGHEEHSFSKLAEKGCDKPLNWEYSEIKDLLFKLEKIQKKCINTQILINYYQEELFYLD